MSTSLPRITPEDRLDSQIALLTEMLTDSVALVKSHAEREHRNSRKSEVDTAMDIARRSAELGTALARLRANFTFNIRRDPVASEQPAVLRLPQRTDSPAPSLDMQLVREMESELGPLWTEEEAETIDFEEVRARCKARTEDLTRRRAAHGLHPYPADPERRLGEPESPSS